MKQLPFEVPGGWTQRTLELESHRFELLLPADPDQVLEQQLELEAGRVAGSGPGSLDPYWAALWSSATPTAEAVLREAWSRGAAAIELGCGMGLVGLAAMAAGLQVTFTDHVHEAVQLALENARRNGFCHARGQQLDWHAPASGGQAYPLILASDVLYSRGNHLPLLDTIDRLLAPDGVCWLGDPGRYNSHDFPGVARRRFRVELRDRDGNSLTVPHSGQYQRFVLRRR
jgi:predicted nicotinamide N-methyase